MEATAKPSGTHCMWDEGSLGLGSLTDLWDGGYFWRNSQGVVTISGQQCI